MVAVIGKNALWPPFSEMRYGRNPSREVSRRNAMLLLIVCGILGTALGLAAAWHLGLLAAVLLGALAGALSVLAAGLWMAWHATRLGTRSCRWLGTRSSR